MYTTVNSILTVNRSYL